MGDDWRKKERKGKEMEEGTLIFISRPLLAQSLPPQFRILNKKKKRKVSEPFSSFCFFDLMNQRQ